MKPPPKLSAQGTFTCRTLGKLFALLKIQTAVHRREIFLTLPSKSDYPDYFKIIKKPIALGIIKQKIDKRKYRTTDLFCREMQRVLKTRGRTILQTVRFIQTLTISSAYSCKKFCFLEQQTAIQRHFLYKLSQCHGNKFRRFKASAGRNIP